MVKIRSLGYAGFGAPKPEVWLQYATNIIGLMPARACAGEDWGIPAVSGPGPASGGSGIAEDGSVYLKLDEWQWRIGIHPSKDNHGLLYLGLEVEDQFALEAAVDELKAAGCEAQIGSESQARARAVTGIAFTRDPMGNAVELFYGPTVDHKFVSPRGMRFVTGELGLGHLNLLAAPLEEARHFYTRILGFRLTDYIRFGETDSANFFHCNRRHHSLGLLRVGELKGIHHMMLEVASVDMVLQCLDRVRDAGITVTASMGRHVNDHMLSFYMRSPFGFEVEIGCEGRLLDETWTPNAFVEGDLWGHRGLDPATINENLEGRVQKKGGV